MKKALKLFLMYFVFFALTLLIGTFFYSLYLNVLGFISEQKLNFFDKDIILKALFLIAYCSCFIVPSFLCYYRIRHPFGVPQTIAFVILVLLTWGVIFPGIGFLERICYENIPSGNSISHLSGGVFRQSGDKVYYFTRDFYSNPYTGEDTNTIVIDTSDNGEVDFTQIMDTPGFELYEASQPYNEIQAKNIFKTQNLKLPMDIRFLADKGLMNFYMGWTFYLGFVSMGILLGALYALTSFFSWKLLNTCSLAVGTILILSVNTLMFSPFVEGFIRKMENNSFICNLKSIFENPTLVLMNLIFSLLLIGAGVLRIVIINHKKKKAQD